MSDYKNFGFGSYRCTTLENGASFLIFPPVHKTLGDFLLEDHERKFQFFFFSLKSNL